NAAVIARWVATSGWAEFLAIDPVTRSNTSVCLSISPAATTGLDAGAKAGLPRAIAAALDAEGVAFDVAGHRDAPPGLRIWTGATVETSDLEALMPWLDWAWDRVSAAALTT